jgi:hypothetical protein
MPKFISEIKQSGNSDFALLDSLNLRGGFMQVSTIEERDSINSDKLRKGMLVYVESDETIYKYRGDTWTVFDVSSEVKDIQLFTVHSEVTNVEEEEDYYKLTFSDDIFLGNDLIGYNIKEDLSGNYLKIEYVKDGYIYINKDFTPPNIH